MKVQVISGFCQRAGLNRIEGDVFDVPEEMPVAEARLRIAKGYLVEIAEDPAPAPPEPEPEPEHPEAGEEMVDRDPKPRRGGRRSKEK